MRLSFISKFGDRHFFRSKANAGDNLRLSSLVTVSNMNKKTISDEDEKEDR